MTQAGWADVWHMIVAIVARQPPFAAIAIATGAVFVAVMALEGCRSSLRAIFDGHRSTKPPPPPAEKPALLAASEPIVLPPLRPAPPRKALRLASAPPRRPKPLTMPARNFRSPRPKIRRHPALILDTALPDFSADPAVLAPEGV